MTDVLGICLRWSEEECVVQPETGVAVTIPLSSVVAGKPVPPRPSVRGRVSALEVERHSLVLWPEMTLEPLGGWVLRAAPPVDGRRRRRGNSVLAMDDPGRPLEEALQRVRDFYEVRDQPALAMVELGSPLDVAITGAGWVPIDLAPAHAQVASVARAHRASGPAPSTLETRETAPGVVEVRAGDRALGRAAIDGDWVGLHGVQVDPDHRRRGLATSVVAGLLDWGAEQGATTAWLHVESDNTSALQLYEGLGFRTHHTCRYLTPAG